MLADGQWVAIEPLLPTISPLLGGRPSVHDRRPVLGTILFVLVSGCQRRMAPHDLMPWSTTYGWFAAWTADRTWDRVLITDDATRSPRRRCWISQSAKSSEGGEVIGYDAGKTGPRPRTPPAG